MFSLFPSLPLELREEIWRYHLPDATRPRPALVCWKRGCWVLRPLPRKDDDEDDDDHHHHHLEEPLQNNCELRFLHETLDKIEVDLPLLHVSRESRDVVLAWARKQGFALSRRRRDNDNDNDNDGQHVLLRPFNPSYDTMYVSFDQWSEFCMEPRRLSTNFGIWKSDVTRLAVPERLVRSGLIAFNPTIKRMLDMRVLNVVVDPQPSSFQERDGASGGQHQWELEYAPWALVFNSRSTRIEYRDADDNESGEGTIYDMLQDFLDEEFTSLLMMDYGSLALRPAYAVREGQS